MAEDKRIIKFIKESNGNVLLKKLDNTLITSFNPAQNLLVIPESKDKFKIQSNSVFGENPLVLDYKQINCELCDPVIEASSFNEFLTELSAQFFYQSTAPTVQEVFIKDFPTPAYLHKYVNPYLCDGSYYLQEYNPFIVRCSLLFDSNVSNNEYKVVNNETFDNRKKKSFVNSYGDTPKICSFWDYTRFMDMYISLEPNLLNLPTENGTQILAVDFLIDVRTNELFVHDKYFGRPEVNINHPSGYYLLKQNGAVSISDGLLIKTPMYKAEVMFIPVYAPT
jgi:hypothetical protein